MEVGMSLWRQFLLADTLWPAEKVQRQSKEVTDLPDVVISTHKGGRCSFRGTG